jgi:hypothetical protein
MSAAVVKTAIAGFANERKMRADAVQANVKRALDAITGATYTVKVGPAGLICSGVAILTFVGRVVVTVVVADPVNQACARVDDVVALVSGLITGIGGTIYVVIALPWRAAARPRTTFIVHRAI